MVEMRVIQKVFIVKCALVRSGRRKDISYLMFKTIVIVMCYDSPKIECMTKSYDKF